MDQVQITYFGHACFQLTGCGKRIVLDPYQDGSVPGLRPVRLEAEAVYCSHGHYDHDFRDGVTLVGSSEGTAPEVELEAPHDDAGGAKRGMTYLRKFRFGEVTVAHLGDLGRPLTAAELTSLGSVDCLLIPVGGYYTIDAREAKAVADAIGARVVIPMHFRTEKSGYDVIAPVDEFTRLCPAFETTGDTVTVTKDQNGILVMKPRNEE